MGVSSCDIDSEFHTCTAVPQCTDGSIGTRVVHPVAFRNESPTELWQRRPAQWRRLRWQNPLAGKDEYLIWESASCECERSVRATHTGRPCGLAIGEHCSRNGDREIADGGTRFSFPRTREKQFLVLEQTSAAFFRWAR